MAEIGQGADDRRQHRFIVERDNGKVKDLEEVGEVSDANSISIRVSHHHHSVSSFEQTLR